jgi:hypothetical protein
MSWPATTEANNFRQTYLKGFLDLSGGDITNRTGGIFVESDISSNANVYTKNHISIGTNFTTFTANSLKLANEQLKMTIPLHLTTLKYFSTYDSASATNFDIADSETETDTTFYVKLNPSLGVSPYFIFSLEPNGAAMNDENTNLTLYRGNTYIFIRSDANSVRQFNIGSAYSENNTGMHITSTGSGSAITGNYTHEYPLSVNGTANIKKSLLVERDISLNGAIKMGSVVYQF